MVLVVLPGTHAQKIVEPVARLGTVRRIHTGGKTLNAFRIEDHAPFVEPVNTDLFAGLDM